MVTTKYNFKAYIKRTYPDISTIPVYGAPAYILTKALSPEDMYMYNVQQLQDGRYLAIIGPFKVSSVKDLINSLNVGKIPTREHSKSAPTTFSCFEQWCVRNGIQPLNRTFCSHKAPSELFHTQDINNCVNVDEPRTWYMYEIPVEVKENGILSEEDVERYAKVPYIIIKNRVVCLIKATNSKYKSKRQMFIDHARTMQPIYEQLVSVAATASAQDDIHKKHADVEDGSDKWEEAKRLCEQYMGIQFEYHGTVDIERLKEATNDGILGLFVRDRQNLVPFQGIEGDDF